MTKFRKLVEDQVQQVLQKPAEPSVLTDEIKAQVLEKVNTMEPNIEELGSYVHHDIVHIGEPPFGPDDDDDYDEDEYYAKQIDEFIDGMHADSIVEMINIPQEKWEDTNYLNRLETEIEVWLNSIRPSYY